MDVVAVIVIMILLGHYFSSLRDTQFSKNNKKEYMSSVAWQLKREMVLARDKHSCRSCTSLDRLEVHHITYQRLGNEKLSDLVTVCRDCHQKIHDKYGYNYQTLYPIR